MNQSKINSSTRTNNNNDTANGNTSDVINEAPASLSHQHNFDDEIQPATQPAIPRSQPMSTNAAAAGQSVISVAPPASSQANHNNTNN